MTEEHKACGTTRRPFTFDRVVRIVFSVLMAFLALWLINTLSSVLLPFAVAWLIAYMLEPLVQRNRKVLHIRGRLVPVLFTLLEVVLLVVVVCVTFLPSIFDELHQVAALVREYTVARRNIPFVPAAVHEFILTHIDLIRISDLLTQENIESVISVLGGFLSGGVSVIMTLFDWFLVVLYVIFIMLDYEKLIVGFKGLVPPKYRTLLFGVFDDVKDSMNHYFRGQALIAFTVGVLFSIGFLIVGLPLAIVLGMFIGLLNMVPYLQLVSLPITTLLCLVYSVQDGPHFWPLFWACMAVYVVVQCTQDLFLTPKIMGKAMGMNPAIILLSLSIWGSLLGIIGMIIALPLTTLMLSYYNRYIIERHHPECDDDTQPSSEISA